MTGYQINNDFEKMDLKIIYAFITNSYWAKGIPEGILFKALSNSLCFGVFDSLGNQVGFARLITDKATFAYLADVFILETHRGKGLSKWLMETIVAHKDLQGLRRVMLATADAHTLYEKFGFQQIENPEILMQIWKPNVYQQFIKEGE